MSASQVRTFLERHTRELVPLFVAARRASWEASGTGTPEAVEEAARAAAALRSLYADPEARARVRSWLEGAEGLDPLLRRQLVLLDHAYTENALPPPVIEDLTRRAQQIEGVFATHRGEMGGRPVSNNDLVRILRRSRDEEERRAAWEASKSIGPRIEEPLRELARRRNEAARSIGFRDFYHMELALQEIREDALLTLCGQLRELTEGPYRTAKAEIDRALGATLGIPPEELRPHHYGDPFFQEVPEPADISLDPLFQDRDLVAVAERFFAGIGLPVEEILRRSDLYEREGKDQHAFCTHIDREGDVRILCNLRPDERWMQTLLHELGHGVYDLYLPRSLPFLLRRPAHMLTTEAAALLFGRLPRSPGWLAAAVGLEGERRRELDRVLPGTRRRAILVFTRWALVMIYFEREFYGDPEREDLNRLWWEIVSELQGLRPPDGVEGRHDWATKIHLATAPVYYHNYLLGELFASQLARAIRAEVGAGPDAYAGRREVGAFLRERLFGPGAALTWTELARHATGEPLGPDAFVAEYLGAGSGGEGSPAVDAARTRV